MTEPLRQPTPLLRLGRALLKLECLRPSASLDDRALPLWDRLGEPARPGSAGTVFSGTGGAALAAAAWSRRWGLALVPIVHGAVTHEVREALRIWGLEPELVPRRSEALRRAAAVAQARAAALLPPLDGDEAAEEFARSLGEEIGSDLRSGMLSPALLVAPASARAALLGVGTVLRRASPDLRVVALCGSSADVEELPELPQEVDLPARIERAVIGRAFAAGARGELARTLGLLATHAGAASALFARDAAIPPGRCALAIVPAAGEREFSLDSRSAA